MAVRDFPFLADLIPTIMNNVDQPTTDAIRETYDNPGEVMQHVRLEQDFLTNRISALDEGYNFAQDATIAVATGDTTTAMPADCSNVLELYRLGASGQRSGTVGLVDQHQWVLHSNAGSSVAFYSPSSNLLIWPGGAPATFTMEVGYEKHLPMPVHGIVQDAGPTTLQLGSHELTDDDVYIGLVIKLYSGTGEDQSQAVTDYNGVTRTATFGTSWTTTPVGIEQANTTLYTSRPSLPREAMNAFVEGVSLRLMGKLQEAVDMKRRPMLAEFIDTMEEILTRKARKRVDVIRNDAGRVFRDPHEEVWNG